MRRALLAALLTAATLAPSTHAAPPAPQVRDPRGDVAVTSHDILTGRLSSERRGAATLLRGDLKLAAAPALGVPNMYQISFVKGCDRFSLLYVWPGVAERATATLDYGDYCQMDSTSLADESTPVALEVRGTTIVWHAPFLYGLRLGDTVTHISAAACPKFCDPYAKTFGDLAPGLGKYVVGSDLPRR